MIILIHGDNIESSRLAYLKKLHTPETKEVRILDGKTVDTTNFIQTLESASLFGNSLTIGIERLLSTSSKSDNKIEKYIKILSSQSNDMIIILWEDRIISPSILKKFGNLIKTEIYKYPVLIFQFLDSFVPSKGLYLIPLFQRIVKTEPPEVLFSLLVRRIRDLMKIKDGVITKELAPWQITRLTTQAKLFTMEKLVKIYQTLGEVEYEVKSGISPLTLSTRIELILTSF